MIICEAPLARTAAGIFWPFRQGTAVRVAFLQSRHPDSGRFGRPPLIPCPSFLSRPRRARGFALPVLLVLLVIMTVAVLSLFSVSQNDFSSTRGYSRGIQAKLLAEVATDEILQDLRTEIAGYEELRRDGWSANATALASGLFPAQVLPGLSGSLTARNVNPLLRVSQAGSTYSDGFAAAGLDTTTAPANRASSVNTLSDPALRGRKVPLSRWQATGLLSDATVAALRPPDWIYTTRNGSVALSDSDIAEARRGADMQNPSQVLGRYAFMAYDVSGLLDINVAGALEAADPGTKGGTFFSRLDPVLGSASAAAFLQWRDADAAAPANRLYGTASTAGEIEAGTAGTASQIRNQLFARQDLLAMTQGDGILSSAPANATQMLRTWSASSPAPGDIIVWDQAENERQRLASDYTTTVNLTIPAFRLDGSAGNYTITASDENPAPRFQRKFPLARLRWFSDPTAKAAAIKQHFGLRRSGSPGLSVDEGRSFFSGWVYCSPDGTAPAGRIKSLSEIQGREPDFFEWLKAAIDPGSLGFFGGNASLVGTTTSGTLTLAGLDRKDTSRDLQILRIGANVLDQADADDVPSLVYSELAGVGPEVSAGVENLPYINEILWSLNRKDPSSPLIAYTRFELWNPHLNALREPGRIPRDADGNEIDRFRVRFTRGACTLILAKFMDDNKSNAICASYLNGMPNSRDAYRGVHGAGVEPTAFFNLVDKEVQFQLPNSQGGPQSLYQEPALIEDTNRAAAAPVTATRPLFQPCSAPSGNGTLTASIPLGSLPLPARAIDPTWVGEGGSGNITLSTQVAPTIQKKVADVGIKHFDTAWIYKWGTEPRGAREPVTTVLEAFVDGEWRPYQSIERHDDTIMYFNPYQIGSHLDTNWEVDHNDTTNDSFYGWNRHVCHWGFAKVDPRSPRWGVSARAGGTAGSGMRNSTAALSFQTAFADAGNWEGSNRWFAGQERDGSNSNAQAPDRVSGWTVPLPSGWPANRRRGMTPFLASNESTNEYFYEEEDQLSGTAPQSKIRRADYAGVFNSANFVSIPVSEARPVVLNRPFRSVGELGYVFRDTPWRTVDLFFPESGDTGLAEIFSIGDSESPPGKINPLASPSAIIEGLINGTLRDALGSARVDTAERAATAATLAALSQSPPDELAPNLKTLLAELNDSASTRSASASFKLTKTQGEAVARALVDASDFRTWNLLIDLLVQTGDLPANAGSLRAFHVAGERRYWVHVAIDRITGNVVSMKSEPRSD